MAPQYSTGWTPIVELQTGQAVSDKFDAAFNNVDTALTGLETDIESVRTQVLLHGIKNPNVPLISLNVDNTKYEIEPFTYYIQGSEYSYAGSVESANFAQAGDFKVIGIGTSGLIIKTNTFFTPVELKTTLEIGRIATDNGSSITSIGDSAFYVDDMIQNLFIRFKAFENTAFGDGAGLISEYLVGQLSIQGGYISDANLNIDTIPSEDGLDVFPIYNVGGSLGIRPLVTDMVVPDDQYDDGANLIAIPNNKFVAHTLFRSSGTGRYYLEYGTLLYDTVIEAQNGIIQNNYFSDLGSEVEPLAKIIVQEGAGIQDIQDARSQSTAQSSTAVSVLGWKDNINPFSAALGNGVTEPNWEDIGNGLYAYHWTTGEKLFTTFHVDHDYALGTPAFPHIHFFCKQVQAIGNAITWRFSYTIAKGHAQGESLTGTPVDIDMTYVFDGTEIAGEHIVLECADIDAFDLKEPDTLIMASIELLNESVTGDIVGIMSDLHYQSDRESTPFKEPNFLTGV